jgi:hypothetical protein
MFGRSTESLMKRGGRIRGSLLMAACVMFIASTNAHARQGSAVPKSVEAAPGVVAAAGAEWLTKEEQQAARVEHGLWTADDLTVPALRARAAVDAGIPNAVAIPPAGEVEATLVAEALIAQGRSLEAIAALTDLPGITAAALRAEAFEAMGRMHEAAQAAEEASRDLDLEKARSCRDFVMAARAMMVMARARGADEAACERIMATLAKGREMDRLDWRARVAEGRFLIEKHNLEEAVAALTEAVRLNPRAAESWFLLGRIALMGFDFDGAARAALAIREAAATVEASAVAAPAALLDAESACARFDSAEALAALERVREAMPSLLSPIALEAAAHALTYEYDAMRASLATADALAPASARAYWQVARFLALARQYADARDLLLEAQRREPNWSVPRNELGLLEMQAGHDAEALAALTEAARLDPFDKRVAFSKRLVEDLISWKVLESEHFRVRCRPGIDEALAAGMLGPLEEMYREVTARFEHEPREKTTIELMPDHAHFAVRITGMPQIHTVAASTGPVIALEPPKEMGRGRSIGRFDWLDTLRHEFVHTVTLDRTLNRIPHWFTEAAAVDIEHKRRDWTTYQLLANALEKDELFDLDEIKWAFVRPKRKNDRAQAYAQGHWMVEFMRESFGTESLVRLLDRYARGEREVDAFKAVLGLTREQFMTDFTAWARAQVASWRLSEAPPIDELITAARAAASLPEDAPLTDEILHSLIKQHPDHADLLEILAHREVARSEGAPREQQVPVGLDEAARAALERYAKVRPLDPWPHQRLAAYAVARNDMVAAAPHLEFLDARADSDPAFATELAAARRSAKNLKGALEAAERAARIDPYDAATRELAAVCAVEASELERAREHIVALTLIEPTRERHAERLRRIDQMIAQRKGATTAQ